MNRKAQVTIFIIIAIVIIALVVLFFLLRTKVSTQEISDIQNELVQVDPQVRPVQQYIVDSLDDAVIEGIEILGLQGGYIYLPSEYKTNIIKTRTEGKHVVEMNGEPKLIRESGTTKIPIWIDKDKISIPSLEFMEQQLKIYLENKLNQISLSSFESQGIQIEQREPVIIVDLGEKTVVEINWPTTIEYQGETYRFEDLAKKTINLNLPKVHTSATTLAANEIYHSYLESHARELLSLYGYRGGSKGEFTIPPYSFSVPNQDCDFEYWSYPEIESRLKAIFKKNYPYLKIDKTNYQLPGNEGIYKSFVYNLLPESQTTHIDFSYDPEQNLNLQMYPEDLLPDRAQQTEIPFLPSICIFDYENYYTFSTPILTKITEDSIEVTGKSFEFYFPMVAYLCNNGKRECLRILEKEISIDKEEVESTTGERLYNCQDISATNGIKVVDERNLDLEGVDITHSCEGYLNTCWLGRTNSEGKSTINIPACDTNSMLKLTKLDYQPLYDSVKSRYVMMRLKDFTVDFKLVHAKKFAEAYYVTNGFTSNACGRSPGSWLDEAIYEPNENDSIIISFNGPTQGFANYPETDEMQLGYGIYNISTFVTSYVKINPSYFEGAGYMSFNNESTEEPYVGEWMLGSASHQFNLELTDMLDKNEVRLYALVEHVSTEELELADFIHPIISSEGLKANITVDSNCDGGVGERVYFELTKDEYKEFIKPQFIESLA